MNCFYQIVRCLIWCSLSIFVTIIMGLGMKNYVRNCTEKESVVVSCEQAGDETNR